MILGIDIGNTNIVLGCFEDEKIIKTFRITTDKNKSCDEYIILINNLFSFENINLNKIDGSIISSVVPELTNILNKAIYKIINVNSLVVNKNLNMDLNIIIDTPEKLGSDLIVDAVAAVSLYPNIPLIIFDMGTATTVSVIDKDKNYIGGLIIPGLMISLNALSKMTSQIPSIYPEKPKDIIGKNTVDAMQSGIVYGNAYMVDGIISELKCKFGKDTKTIATGGLSNLIVPFCKSEIIYNQDLMMYGLIQLYKTNKL